jgi:hypothetical protein
MKTTPSPRRFVLLRRVSCKRTHTREVVGSLTRAEQVLDPLAVSMHRLTNPTDCLARAEDLLDAFSRVLADDLASSARRASVNRRATRAAVALRHMRRHTTCATTRHEARRVVVLVGPNRNRGTGSLRCFGEHLSRGVSFSRTAGVRHLRAHRQTGPVIRPLVSTFTAPASMTAAATISTAC